jgi:hypothetical protein
MTARKLLLTSLSMAIAMSVAAQAKISAGGQGLAKFLDGLDVEKKWLASSEGIDWQTGEVKAKSACNPVKADPSKDPKAGNTQPEPVIDKKLHTHCSSFVSAVCAKLGVHILSPPEHSPVLLSNAQYDWLLDKGPEEGWNQILLPVEAQDLANQGNLVVAVWKNPVEKPGHIAIVRPSDKQESQIAQEGPDVIQAGTKNFKCTTLKEAFKNHKGAFENSEILFFSHEIPAKK